MRVKEEFTEAQRRFGLLSFYDKFEHIVILILTVLIAVFIVFAIWNLALKIFLSHRLIAAPKVSAFSFWSDANAARPSRERLMPRKPDWCCLLLIVDRLCSGRNLVRILCARLAPRYRYRRVVSDPRVSTVSVLTHQLAKTRESGMRTIRPTIATTITMTTTFGSLKL